MTFNRFRAASLAWFAVLASVGMGTACGSSALLETATQTADGGAHVGTESNVLAVDAGAVDCGHVLREDAGVGAFDAGLTAADDGGGRTTDGAALVVDAGDADAGADDAGLGDGSRAGGEDAGSGIFDAGPASGPDAGRYTKCAQQLQGSDGNVFLNGGAFEPGATLTLSQGADAVTATYVDENGVTYAVDFAVTSGASASLASPGAPLSGFTGLCVQGPLNQTSHPATLSVAAGTLTYASGIAMFSVEGTLQGTLGACGVKSETATFTVVCEDGPSAPLAADAGSPASGSTFPAGTYSCTSGIDTYISGSPNQILQSAGHGGTLTVKQAGSIVTAKYGGDDEMQGTLSFDVATPAAAIASPGQSVTIPCQSVTQSTPPPESLPVTTASLMVDGPRLVVAIAGTFPGNAACSTADEVATLVCTRK